MNGMSCLGDALVRGMRQSMGVKSRWSVSSVKLYLSARVTARICD